MKTRQRGSFILEAAFGVLCLGALGAAALPLPDQNGSCRVTGKWDGVTFVNLTCSNAGCAKACVIAGLGTPALLVCECPGETDQACTAVVEVTPGGQQAGFFCIQIDECLFGTCQQEEPTGAVGAVMSVCTCR
jgi:hypothetical protein